MDPLQGTPLVMVTLSEDAVVPKLGVGVFLIEEMDFVDEELVEVLEHEGHWWLLDQFEVCQ